MKLWKYGMVCWRHPLFTLWMVSSILSVFNMCALCQNTSDADTQPHPSEALKLLSAAPNTTAPTAIPSTEHEQFRRRLKTNIREIWFYLSSQLVKILKKETDRTLSARDVLDILQRGNEYRRALISTFESLQKHDGYDAWRAQEAEELGALVQKRFHYLQNPINCTTARKLLCRVDKNCDFGCQLHQSVYCFMLAYRNERTLILDALWFMDEEGSEAVFLPLSETCVDANGTSHTPWPGVHETQVVDLSFADKLAPPPPPAYPPFSVPADLSQRLKRLHGNPFAWWVGQFVKYILRPQTNVQQLLVDVKLAIKFMTPIVGVHIEKIDKNVEQRYHPIKQYMSAAEEYFKVLELTQEGTVRRIFVACDNPQIILKLKNQFPEYEVITDMAAKNLSELKWTIEIEEYNLIRMVINVHILSLSDFLICTFSSDICRLAYEMMQTYHPDAADRFRSLDDVYKFHQQDESHYQQAVYPHKARNDEEINLQVGDIVTIEDNHWNGFSTGTNIRSSHRGFYPSFKAVDAVITDEFPTYSEVPQEDSGLRVSTNVSVFNKIANFVSKFNNIKGGKN